MRIGFDIDGVLYNWQRLAYEYCVNFCHEKRTYEQFWEDLNTDKFTQIFRDNLLELPLYRSLNADRNYVLSLNELGKKNHIYYVTGRPPSAQHATEKWLHESDFPQTENLYLTPDKLATIRKLGLDYFVEDRGEIAIKLINITEVILVKQPWNIHLRQFFNFIVDNVTQVKEIINASN